MDESPIKENYTSSKILINDLIRLTRSDQYIFQMCIRDRALSNDEDGVADWVEKHLLNKK